MNAPNEINAAALKTGTTEKVTPMMAQYLRTTFLTYFSSLYCAG